MKDVILYVAPQHLGRFAAFVKKTLLSAPYLWHSAVFFCKVKHRFAGYPMLYLDAKSDLYNIQNRTHPILGCEHHIPKKC